MGYSGVDGRGWCRLDRGTFGDFDLGLGDRGVGRVAVLTED